MEAEFYSVPVMSCAEAKIFEKKFFSSQNAVTEKSAMETAGTRVGEAILRECRRARRDVSRLLVLVGKGHNGGDALIAASRIFSKTSCRVGVVIFAESEEKLAPLTREFLSLFCATVPEEKRFIEFASAGAPLSPRLQAFSEHPHVLIDGIFGHSFRAPFPPEIRKFAEKLCSVRSRDSLVCSVDLPSGLSDDAGEADFVLRADWTFPTGILKTPLLEKTYFSGRIFPVCIAFSGYDKTKLAVADEAYFLRKIFSPRPVVCDKRDFGHVLIVGGSRTMPGALLMNVLAALRAGAGLVSVIYPERVQAAFAARAPGAMWIPCPENADGGLDAQAGFAEFEKILPRVSAVLCGSGMGISAGAQELIQKTVKATPCEIPLILDADALRPETLRALRERNAEAGKTLLLPHAGEFSRLGGNAESPRRFCAEHSVLLALKGACTRIVSSDTEWLTFSGTPALARGGSGDVLAGIVAAMFASPGNFDENATAAERLIAAVVWHGNAARKLADEQGERCADISALPEFLGKVSTL